MATQKERPNNWKARGLIKRDFQHDHSGPEELPYRKKGKGKKYCKANKSEHVYDTWSEWRTYTRYRYRYAACKCGKTGWKSQSQSLVEYTYIDRITGEETKRSHWT